MTYVVKIITDIEEKAKQTPKYWGFGHRSRRHAARPRPRLLCRHRKRYGDCSPAFSSTPSLEIKNTPQMRGIFYFCAWGGIRTPVAQWAIDLQSTAIDHSATHASHIGLRYTAINSDVSQKDSNRLKPLNQYDSGRATIAMRRLLELQSCFL
ncbi:MAG: hypothetical protein RL094_592 [Candidatus Parcubacteria bacterium]